VCCENLEINFFRQLGTIIHFVICAKILSHTKSTGRRERPPNLLLRSTPVQLFHPDFLTYFLRQRFQHFFIRWTTQMFSNSITDPSEEKTAGFVSISCRTRKDVGVECRHDMRSSIQLPIVSGVQFDSKRLIMVRPSLVAVGV